MRSSCSCCPSYPHHGESRRYRLQQRSFSAISVSPATSRSDPRAELRQLLRDSRARRDRRSVLCGLCQIHRYPLGSGGGSVLLHRRVSGLIRPKNSSHISMGTVLRASGMCSLRRAQSCLRGRRRSPSCFGARPPGSTASPGQRHTSRRQAQAAPSIRGMENPFACPAPGQQRSSDGRPTCLDGAPKSTDTRLRFGSTTVHFRQ